MVKDEQINFKQRQKFRPSVEPLISTKLAVSRIFKGSKLREREGGEGRTGEKSGEGGRRSDLPRTQLHTLHCTSTQLQDTHTHTFKRIEEGDDRGPCL